MEKYYEVITTGLNGSSRLTTTYKSFGWAKRTAKRILHDQEFIKTAKVIERTVGSWEEKVVETFKK